MSKHKTKKYFFVAGSIIMVLFAIIAIICNYNKEIDTNNFEDSETYPTDNQDGLRHSVMVIDSWGQEYIDADSKPDLLTEHLTKEGIKANIHRLRINAKHNTQDNYEKTGFSGMRDIINKKWKPEIIIVNDDPALIWLIKYHKYDTLFTKRPIVFAGITTVPMDSLRYFSKITGFKDTIALRENLDIIREVRNTYSTAISVEGSPYQQFLRDNILRQIHSDKYLVDNTDFHLSLEEVVEIEQKLQNCFVVGFVSSASPYLNSPTHDLAEGKRTLHIFYRDADKHTQLQVQYGLSSNTIIDRSSKPQFTAINEQFGIKGRPRILCGFFASYETQVKDQAHYAAQILKGVSIDSLPVMDHKKAYYMDFNAMKRLYSEAELEQQYARWAKKFEIINAPDQIRHPGIWGSGPIVLMICIVILLIVIMTSIMKWRNQTRIKQQEVTRRKLNQRKLLFATAKATTWIYKLDSGIVHITYLNGFKHHGEAIDIHVDQLQQHVHPDSRQAIKRLIQNVDIRGNYTERIQLSLDNGQTYTWQQLTYTINADSQRRRQVLGLAVDITDRIELEQAMKQAYDHANELAMKQEFLLNFDTRVLEPMEKINDIAKTVCKQSETCSPEQMKSYAKTIHEQSEELLSKLDNAIGKAENVRQNKKSSLSGLLGALFCIMTLLGMTSCQDKPDYTSKKVLVVHSYSSEMPDYIKFDSLIISDFQKNGIDPDIRNLYMSMIDDTETGHTPMLQLHNELKKENWEPDIVIVEGDEAVRGINLPCNDSILTFIKTKPIAYGGLYVPDWNLLRLDKSSVIYTDPINFSYNISLATSLSGSNVVQIELDHTPKDSILLQSLRQTVNHRPYLDNSDYHLHIDFNYNIQNLFPDSITIITLSAKEHQKNTSSGYPNDGEHNTQLIYTFSSRYANLVIKKDVFSNSIIDKTGKPEFTAIKEGFDDGENKFLAGYFASYETVAADLVKASMYLSLPDRPDAISLFTHQQNSYMNYAAMQQMGLEYDKFKDAFQIIGVPYRVSHPVEYWGMYIGGIVAILILVMLIAYYVIGKYYIRIYKIQQQITEEHELSNNALEGKYHVPVVSEINIREVADNMHPDHEEIRQRILDSINKVGTYQFEALASRNHNEVYSWWKIYYTVEQDTNGAYTYDGLLLSTEEDHKLIEELKKATRIAEEATAKENFLMKLRHEMRTPLNIIQGSCDILASDFADEMTSEEKAEYIEAIRLNRIILRMMILDIFTYTQIDRGRMKYNSERINVSQFITGYYNKITTYIPKNLKSRLASGADNLYIKADVQQLYNVLKQLVSNAIKYTDVGTIAVGWQRHISTQEVEIYVQDTGRGISPSKQASIFELFWKDDGFVPGLGVGLHIAKLITSGMGGRITVDSQVGKGSRFSIYFKIEDEIIV